jgi:hypothetical protein
MTFDECSWYRCDDEQQVQRIIHAQWHVAPSIQDLCNLV